LNCHYREVYLSGVYVKPMTSATRIIVHFSRSLKQQIYTSFIHQRTGRKVKKGTQEQTQINLTNMQLYPNFTVQPGLKVIKKANINSITQLTYSFNISSILLENVM